MTSFAVAIEPPANPRLAAIALGLHLAAAASPWLARVPPWLAAALTLFALAGLASSLAAVPGPHGRLAGIRCNGREWSVRMHGDGGWQAAELGAGSRAFAGVAFVDVRAAGRRHAWLLTRESVPPDSFRRLKARIRLTC
jgi:hypothetical protein